MSILPWQQSTLIERIRWLRYALPPLLIAVVIIYQLGIAQRLEQDYGHVVHYSVEIAFYSLVGPIVTLLTLSWVERNLRAQEILERQVQVRTQQLASLTAVSADAIISLDGMGKIISWNQGAERMLGFDEASIVGQQLIRILPEADFLAHRLIEHESVESFETRAISADGQNLTVELTQTPFTEQVNGLDVGLIIMRDVTARRERESIRAEERARIARDLHDGVAQTLYFMALKTDMVRQQIRQKPDWAASEMKEIGLTARQVIREVRRTIFALRPLIWSEGEFIPALTRFVNDFAEQVGWQAEVVIDGKFTTISNRLELLLFRLVQESLNNAAKHAHAQHIRVKLEHNNMDSMIRLEVRDDGLGFDPDDDEKGGLGMKQMRERVADRRGILQVESLTGEGTVVLARLPILGRTNGDN